MRKLWNGKLHRIQIAMDSQGWALRFCEHCGATWQLVHVEGGAYAFRPVKELDPNGKELEVDVDVRECNAEAVEKETTAPVAVVTPVPAADTRFCYCGDCHKQGRKQHYPGDELCYCVKHKGRERHKIV